MPRRPAVDQGFEQGEWAGDFGLGGLAAMKVAGVPKRSLMCSIRSMQRLQAPCLR